MLPLSLVFPLVYESQFFFLNPASRSFIRRVGFLRRGFPFPSSLIQIAVIPFKIDVPRHMNLDDCAWPTLLFLEVVFKELDVILADGRRKQLAEICQGIMKVFRFADLFGIDNPAHPYFVELIPMLLDQALEIDRIDQRSFAVCISADLYRLLDEGKRRTRAQSRCIDGALIGFITHSMIGKQRKLLLIKIPGIVENEGLLFLLFISHPLFLE